MENKSFWYKNIIWDWNGTIIDDAWLFVDIMNSFLKKELLPPTSLKHYRKNFCFPIQDYWRNLGFKFTKKDFDVLNAKFIQEYQKKMFLPNLHGGVESLLFNLQQKQIQQFVLSASEKRLLKESVNYYGLNSFFRGVYGVNNLNAIGKLSLGKFVCQQHKLVFHETLFIGDTEYDCEVAQSLGCRVILVSHGHINHQRLLKTGVPVVPSVDALANTLQTNQ